MNDMTQVIVPRSDQWNADDFYAGPITFTITGVAIKGGQEQPVSISLQGSDKAFRPCKSMSRVLVAAWGADANKYVGRSLTLYRDEKVKWAGMEVGGIRISHMSHIDAPMTLALTATKGSRKPHRIEPLTNAPKPANTRQTPEQWADDHIEAIRTAGDNLDAVLAKGEKARAKLATDHPELLAKIDLAIEQARSDDPFAGPSDGQRGESTTLADALDAIANATTEADVNLAYDAVIAMMGDDDAETLISAKNARLAELAG
ncbi:MAG: hypothetical protein V4696_07640 [Pseudomonadota bacterium]